MSDISSIISEGMSNLQTAYLNNANRTTANALQKTLSNTDLANASTDELLSVCKDFEEYFVEQMVKSMVKMANINGDSDDENYAALFGLTSGSSDAYLSSMSNFYGGQMVTKLAQSLCSDENGKGLGLAQTLYEQMKRNYNVTEADASDK